MIALDLDNTIICYDNAFRTAAAKLQCFLPEGLPINKAAVKEAAIKKGGNEFWTRLQGVAYGSAIHEAKPFPGCKRFINLALDRDEKMVILSHKTEYPALGEKMNLRLAAINWIENNGFSFGSRLPIFFCDSREEKVMRLHSLACRTLIDDLPEVYHTPGFAPTTRFVLFDPSGTHAGWSVSPRVTSWDEAADLLLPATS